MSVCGQVEEGSSSEEGGAPLRDLYEQKAVSTVVRVLTVLAYLLSVSLAAILLSVYYVCVWRSPDLPPLSDTGEGRLSARQGHPDDYQLDHTDRLFNYTGGSHTSVSEDAVMTSSPPTEFSSSADASESAQTSSVTTAELPISSEFNTTDVIGSPTVVNDTQIT